MPASDFHKKPFDEGTLTKLSLFELYTREWLPVFLSRPVPLRRTIHLFDFFAGPGTDSKGMPGSPLRILKQLETYRGLPGWSKVQIEVHLFDASLSQIKVLRDTIEHTNAQPEGVNLECGAWDFVTALKASESVLKDTGAAKLVFIDQFGVDEVTEDVFRTLVKAPTCDFIFFLTSSTLYRFRGHPAIKQKISRPRDYYHVHRKVLEYYRELLPARTEFYLAPFSIKKGSNIYGLIFGSQHPLGMDKFLEVAWKQDEINGEADFDIGRDNMVPAQPQLFPEMKPSKVSNFERDLEARLRAGELSNEIDVMKLCFDHGVRRRHAESVLAKLKREKVIDLSFRVPDVNRLKQPRPIRRLR
jgi:three-Cys-motif partner protein